MRCAPDGEGQTVGVLQYVGQPLRGGVNGFVTTLDEPAPHLLDGGVGQVGVDSNPAYVVRIHADRVLSSVGGWIAIAFPRVSRVTWPMGRAGSPSRATPVRQPAQPFRFALNLMPPVQ